MKGRIAELWSRLRSSYWFVPAIMTAGAVALSALVVSVDNRLGADWMRELGWLYQNQPEGARAVLSTVAGSMITVAGVTFSMTLLAVSHASTQMGPRILASFMRDTGNQVTLGTFIATFVYCLLILRTVRGGASDGGSGEGFSPFVPHLGILLALALALASVAVLIYFVHHVPQSINVTNVIDRTGDELLERINQLFPERIAEGRESVSDDAGRAQLPDDLVSAGEVIGATARGYVRRIDGESLIELARGSDLVIELLRRPGDYVQAEGEVMRAWPAHRLDAEIRDQLREVISLGSQRSPEQDMMFPVDQLIEVATRALSPGINDPFTAVECIHQLESGLIEMAMKHGPDGHRSDEEGALRVIARPFRFADVADRVFDALRGHGQAEILINLRLLRVIETVASAVQTDEDRTRLKEHAEAIVAGARTAIRDPRDLERLDVASSEALRALDGAAAGA